jgi:hypothetical protein
MEPREAVATLLDAMNKINDSWHRMPLAEGVSAAAGSLDPGEAAEVAAKLLQFLINTPPNNGGRSLAKALSAAAARMEPREAAALLTQAISRTNDPYALAALAQGLSTVAARLERGEAARVSAEAAATLTQALRKQNGFVFLTQRDLWEGLLAVAAHLEPGEAARVYAEAADRLMHQLTVTLSPDELTSVAHTLSLVAARMEPGEAARVSAKAAALMQAKTRRPISMISGVWGWVCRRWRRGWSPGRRPLRSFRP